MSIPFRAVKYPAANAYIRLVARSINNIIMLLLCYPIITSLLYKAVWEKYKLFIMDIIDSPVRLDYVIRLLRIPLCRRAEGHFAPEKFAF